MSARPPALPAPEAPPAALRTALTWYHHVHEWWLLWWNMLYLGCALLILACSPHSHLPRTWLAVASHVYVRLRWSLLAFVLIAAIVGAVLTQIVLQALAGFSLAHWAPSLLIRILLAEIVPFAAAITVTIRLTIPLGNELAALRREHHFSRLARANVDALQVEVLPRLLMGLYGAIMFCVLAGAAVLAMIYVGIYGYTTAGITVFTHAFGQTMTPFFASVLLAKAIAFSYVIALAPLTTAFIHPRYGLRRDSELATLARVLTLLTLMEVLSLVANYY
ncbi:hypothetical protein AAV94_02530 [Lampropedia cohaerens]|uniref:ABC transporter permease n=1 Tax=Lampropedia cohaerens TaxID=1610491 RepID=A0A0U1Q232_9BURK|nr:ABC transporter permease [Lampropedia cohaerens]KKW68834.1 hypothetical protein AAV94_02530 [Lampropedia cohaerens]